ncbi:LOW QUALITY PROTEIN: carboxypeptidase O [Lynx canadensis]|uniref:LOW QUALITY PROTEIN: carboxypeptidase O n=1 Tax=Lynx canadensis TaxID=61383 RepID=UPI0011B084B7|nr:LOW QUALITY PROTEIN: carboxypeptidase O [Lynx canadensis]
MKFRNAAHLTAGARHSKGDPCVDCICPLTSARQLESVGVRPCSLASAKQWSSVLTTGPMLVLKEGATSELSHLQNGVCQCLHLWGEFQISPDPLAGGKAVHPVSRSFSEENVPYIAIVLVCLREASSGSSYTAVLRKSMEKPPVWRMSLKAQRAPEGGKDRTVDKVSSGASSGIYQGHFWESLSVRNYSSPTSLSCKGYSLYHQKLQESKVCYLSSSAYHSAGHTDGMAHIDADRTDEWLYKVSCCYDMTWGGFRKPAAVLSVLILQKMHKNLLHTGYRNNAREQRLRDELGLQRMLRVCGSPVSIEDKERRGENKDGEIRLGRSLAQHRREVVEETVSQRRGLDAYSYQRYHPMEEIYQWMIQISEKYAEVVTQHFLGMTYETRPMYYLKISQPSNNPKKIIWMDCGIHAREWIAPAFCQWFVKEILQNYKDDSRIKKLLRNLDFYVLPILNIDGYIYTWTTDRLWRKSRSSHNNGTCFGTDLNRNFNVSWCSIGASRNCQDITFCGTGPVSEPETKAVSSLIESKKDNIVCFLTMHSFGQLILTPYGYTKNKSSNHEELIQVGQKAANALKEKHGTNYRVGSSADILYATSGSSRDWARDIGIPFSYTFELRDNGTYGFVLPEGQIQATCEESMAAILSVLDDVYEKYWGTDSAGKAASSAVVLGLLVSFMSLL